MIYPDSVTNAVFTILSSDSVLVSSAVGVELNGNLVNDPSRFPWVGVYEGRIDTTPHAIASSVPWQAVYNIEVYMRTANLQDQGAQVEKDLSALKKAVWTAINSNRTLLGTVDIVTGVKMEPFERRITELPNAPVPGWLATDLMTITAQARGV